jgi:hypothetical protein
MTHADKAAELVLGARNADYGNPHPDFAGIALMWSGLLNTILSRQITAVEVALMMTALKLRREAHKHKDDNLIDAIGYLTCAEWIIAGQKPSPELHAAEHTIAELRQCIEDVAAGTRMICSSCKRSLPCTCEHRPSNDTPVTLK